MKRQWIKALPFFILGMASGAVEATTWDSYMRNRDGVEQFEKKSYHPAYKSFVGALTEDPLNIDVQLNIARTLEANEDYEKAEKAYQSILRRLPEADEQKFQTLFNLANVQGKLKRIPEALETYQAALEIDPDSKEVKTNIELLWQGGEGDGDGDQQKEPKEGEGKGQSQDPQNQPPKQEKPKFQSKDLSQDDVKKILDEIKNQEQNIRAQENDRGAKDAPRGKDW